MSQKMSKPSELRTGSDYAKDNNVVFSLSNFSIVSLAVFLSVVVFIILMLTVFYSPKHDYRKKITEIHSSEYVSNKNLVTFRISKKPQATDQQSAPSSLIAPTTKELLAEQKFLLDESLSGEGGRFDKELQNMDSNYIPSVELGAGKRIPPIYPQRALMRNIEGYVVVEFTINQDGSISNVVILESKPKGVFDKSVLKAVKKFKYSPRIVNGEALAVHNVQNRFEFKLDD